MQSIVLSGDRQNLSFSNKHTIINKELGKPNKVLQVIKRVGEVIIAHSSEGN